MYLDHCNANNYAPCIIHVCTVVKPDVPHGATRTEDDDHHDDPVVSMT